MLVLVLSLVLVVVVLAVVVVADVEELAVVAVVVLVAEVDAAVDVESLIFFHSISKQPVTSWLIYRKQISCQISLENLYISSQIRLPEQRPH